MALKYLKPHVFLANEAGVNLNLICMVPFEHDYAMTALTEQTVVEGTDRILQLKFNFSVQGVPNEHVFRSVHPININHAEPQNLVEIIVSKEGIETGKIRLDVGMAYIGAIDDFTPCSFVSANGGIDYEFSCLINLLNGYSANCVTQHYLPASDNNIEVDYVSDGSLNNFPLSFNANVQIDNNCNFFVKGNGPSGLKIRQKNIF